MKKISFVLVFVLTVIDQVIKMLVSNNLKGADSVVVIPNFLHFDYMENTGASFGMMQNFTWFFTIFTVLVTVFLCVVFVKYKKHNWFTYYAFIAIVAGGIGNLIDRIFLGYVVDYIHVLFFPYIFNFADCLVVTGSIVFGIYYLFFYEKDKLKAQKDLEIENSINSILDEDVSE